MKQVASTFEVPVTPYAVAGDFCRIFAQEMNGLYQLSFLLTTDPVRAEQCFVSGLEDCAGANRVFKEWARSWARRTIVQNAIRLMRPTRKHAGPLPVPVAGSAVNASDNRSPLDALLGLSVFERFVFVMTVLEKHSDHDSKTLLGCSRRDIIRARTQALSRMATFKETPVRDVAIDLGRLFARPHLLAETA